MNKLRVSNEEKFEDTMLREFGGEGGDRFTPYNN